MTNLESCGDSATKTVRRQDRKVLRVGLGALRRAGFMGAVAGPVFPLEAWPPAPRLSPLPRKFQGLR
jgi:hypothetical protein